jgi:hypothetical protein
MGKDESGKQEMRKEVKQETMKPGVDFWLRRSASSPRIFPAFLFS